MGSTWNTMGCICGGYESLARNDELSNISLEGNSMLCTGHPRLSASEPGQAAVQAYALWTGFLAHTIGS